MSWLNRIFGHKPIDEAQFSHSFAVQAQEAKDATVKALDLVDDAHHTEARDEGLREATGELRQSLTRLLERLP